MVDTLRLETKNEPTFLNKEMVIGGLLGLAGGIFIPGGTLLAVAGAAAATLVGGLIGGALGKERIKKENTAGKKVDDKPDFLSKSTVVGTLLGLAAGLAAVVTTLVVTGDASLAVEGSKSIAGELGAKFLALGTLAKAGAIAGLAVPATLGTLVGSAHGKREQVQEYEQAKRQTIGRHLSSTVSPEVGAAVEYTMEHNKNWAKDVAEDKLLASTRDMTRT